MFKRYVATIQLMKDKGCTRDEVLDCLEFDSDEYPDPKELELARDQVYGKADLQRKDDK